MAFGFIDAEGYFGVKFIYNNLKIPQVQLEFSVTLNIDHLQILEWFKTTILALAMSILSLRLSSLEGLQKRRVALIFGSHHAKTRKGYLQGNLECFLHFLLGLIV